MTVKQYIENRIKYHTDYLNYQKSRPESDPIRLTGINRGTHNLKMWTDELKNHLANNHYSVENES